MPLGHLRGMQAYQALSQAAAAVLSRQQRGPCPEQLAGQSWSVPGRTFLFIVRLRGGRHLPGQHAQAGSTCAQRVAHSKSRRTRP